MSDREAAIRDQTIEPWEKHDGVTCVECPRCAFTFDCDHQDADREDVHYSCPQCGEGRALEDGDAARQEAHRLDEMISDLEAELAAAREREAKLREALRNWFEDVDEVMAEDLTLHALQQKLGAIFLGYGGGFNHEDDMRAALADGGAGREVPHHRRRPAVGV